MSRKKQKEEKPFVVAVGFGLATGPASVNAFLAREAEKTAKKRGGKLLLEFPVKKINYPAEVLCPHPLSDPHSAVRVIREAEKRAKSSNVIFVINEVMIPSFTRQIRCERWKKKFSRQYEIKAIEAGYSSQDPQLYVRNPFLWTLRDWTVSFLAAIGISLYR